MGICGIIGDLKREDQGIYVFPCFTLLGFQRGEPVIKKLCQSGYKVSDEDSRHEGVEIKRSSPFQCMRTLAKEFGYSPLKVSQINSPEGRSCLMWTLGTGEATETLGVVADIKRESEENTSYLPLLYLD